MGLFLLCVVETFESSEMSQDSQQTPLHWKPLPSKGDCLFHDKKSLAVLWLTH